MAEGRRGTDLSALYKTFPTEGRIELKKIIRNLVIVFVAFQAADAFLTLWATNNGFQEVNPLMVPFAHTWALPFMKIIPALGAAWLLLKLNARFPRTRPVTAFGFGAGVAFLGVVLVSNVAEL